MRRFIVFFFSNSIHTSTVYDFSKIPPPLPCRRGLTGNGRGQRFQRVAEHQRRAAGLAAHVSHLVRSVQHDEPLVLGLDLGRDQVQPLGRGVVQSLQVRAVDDQRYFRVAVLLPELHDFPVQVIDRGEVQPVVGRDQHEVRSSGLKNGQVLFLSILSIFIIYSRVAMITRTRERL